MYISEESLSQLSKNRMASGKTDKKEICYVDIVIILSRDDSDMNPENTGEDERINMIISRDVLLQYLIE